MTEMSDEASDLMLRLLNLRLTEVGFCKEIANLLASDWLFPKYCEDPIVAVLKAYLFPRPVQIHKGKPSEEALELMRQLLALHYTEGGVPAPIIDLVETSLRGLNLWFHDPGYAYLPGEGYV